MGTTTRNFRTEGEAEAFVQGVEYVNDSSIEVLGIEEDESNQEFPWQVIMSDDDSDDEDEDEDDEGDSELSWNDDEH